MEQKFKRLVTRSDFDGLACAMMLKELGMIEDIKFVHPKDVQDGKVELTKEDITTNLPYDPRVGLAFDHHESEIDRLKATETGGRLIIDPKAKSAARVVYEYLGGKEKLPRISDELMTAVDKGDSADFTLDEILDPKGWVLLHYLMDARTGLGRFRDFRISNYDLMMELIDYCLEHNIDEILALPDVKERVDLYNEQAQQFKDQLRRVARLEGKVVVLVNEFTASAAEIVTGAIQDQDRGLVVGRRTFGKGLVQRPVEFEDGSMMRLTIAHYYTPSGRCIQKPYTKGDKKDYSMDLDQRYKHGEFYSADSIHFADSLKYYTLRKHRTVYGGGGIMPDYFVPLDTTQFTTFHRNLVAKNVVLEQDLKFMDSHRKELKKQYPDFASYMARYEVPQSLVDAIIAEGKKQKVEPKDAAELKATLPYLRLQLKALIARDVWDMSEYFQIMNEQNKTIQQALRLIAE